MSPVPEFILQMREMIGHHPLWLPGITAVITRGDDHVLLVKRADDGAWTPVTGIVDPGEEPAVAAAREALEETGVVISVDRLAATSVLPELTYENGDRAAYLDLTFACTWLSGEAHVADDESTDVRWWPVEDLPPMSEPMMARITAGLADEREARFVTDPRQPALATQGPRVDGAQPPIEPEHPVLGASTCEVGWVGVLLGPDGRPRVHVARSLLEVVRLARQTAEPAVVAIAPSQAHPEGLEQVAALRASEPGIDVLVTLENPSAAVPPESRRADLLAGGLTAPAWFRGGGFTEEDLLDACAAIAEAVRPDRAGSLSPPTLDPC